MSQPDPVARQITLRDGRTLAFTEVGTEGGWPAVYCHGVPSSRAEAAFLAGAAARAVPGVRLIVPDRPGIGLSDARPGRRIVDWPDDVLELSSQLGLGRFGVVGSSGGAPYALACGAALSERVSVVGIIGGVAPLDAPGLLASFPAPLRVMFRLGRSALPLLRALLALNLFGMRHAGEKAAARMAAVAPEPDRKLLAREEVRNGFLACFEEACRQGTRGPAADLALIARPWGVELGSIDVPVLLWHGAQDRNVPVACGRYLSSVLPTCEATFYPDDAHLSVLVERGAEILSALAQAARDRVGSVGG